MMLKPFLSVLAFVWFQSVAMAQGTHSVTDPELKLKTAQQFFLQEHYALAYPLLHELTEMYPPNTISDFTYRVEDVQYYYIACRLKLMHEAAASAAETYIHSTGNAPRKQLMSYQLAHYYYLSGNHEKAIEYYDIAGWDNLSNEEVANAKFEKAYSYFNLKQYAEAKPLFDEIHQLPDHPYYIHANYYYGFIAYRDKDYDKALSAFRLVETTDPFQGVVPYYIAEIYYFKGMKDEAMRYGSSVLEKGGTLYYEKQLKLLIGQLYFEKQDYRTALPLLEDYVNESDKVSKEVLYELSFSYYMTGNYPRAIDGFKQLSNERDSMAQNSMYLLGDLYLKAGDKPNARSAFQFSAFNSSHPEQQRISRFNYAKLSYELGYQDIALQEIRSYINDYPASSFDTEAKEILIAILANTNNYREALDIYRGFSNPTMAMQKSYPRILHGRAIELINDQQLSAADLLLSDVLSNAQAGSLTAYAHFWKGEIAFRQQRYDDAIRHTTQFVQANVPPQGESNMDAARYNLGYSYLYKENYRSAQTQFDAVCNSAASATTPLKKDAYLRLGDASYMLREFSKASTVYNAVIKQGWPSADYAMYQTAMIAGVSSSAEKINIMQQLEKLYPASSLIQDANFEMAQTYIADERFSSAIPFLNKILTAPEGAFKPKAYLKLGLVHYNTGNNREALNQYTTLIERYPRTPEAEEAMGIVKDIYVEENKLNDYLALMRKVGRDVDATEADSLSYAAVWLRYNQRGCEAAIPGFENYMSDYPNGQYIVDAQFTRSICYLEKKQFAEALRGFDQVISRGLSKYYERAALEAGQITYFETKDYAAAKRYFLLVRNNAGTEENLMIALRGLVRSLYQLKDYDEANVISTELLSKKGLSTDDKSIANLVLGKSLQLKNDHTGAIQAFKAVSAINKSGWGAEARYETALSYFMLNDLKASEKAANAVIRETGSYDFWLTRSYILLGDIFLKQKDYFNAKATYKSVAENAAIPELKQEAREKLNQAINEEKKQSKLAD